jgi:hypothetical protein
MAAPAHEGVSVEPVDRDALLRNVDALARRFLKMSGREFLLRKQHQALDQLGDSAAVTRVLSVATLLDD